MFKQSVLSLAMMVLICSLGQVSAREIDVKAGNVRVSVQNGEVEVNTNDSSLKTPSLWQRLTNFSLFNHRNGNSAGKSPAKCDGSTYSQSDRVNTATGVSQTSSSTTTMVCR